jgi:hypothetical protein
MFVLRLTALKYQKINNGEEKRMSRFKRIFALVCMSLLIFAACQSKPDSKGAAPAAAGKPTAEFLAGTLACLTGGGTVEKMEIPIKALLEALDRGDWLAVTLDAEAAKKYSIAWEYSMDQGGGKAISYSFGQLKEDPKFVVVYASANIASGARTPIDAGLYYAKIKAQAEQLKSFK